ncbi:MAG TPA: glycosyltransferase family 4 protein [Candidatus Saccharimonadales bacterium]|nr:glycosyltransferase family 4 protein [Candidatus Saccharimonadales bacterium]
MKIKKAKIIHDNLNAGGGSERLAFATIELLNEIGFKVDLLTLQKPNLQEIKSDFGRGNVNLWDFDQIGIFDFRALLENEKTRGVSKEKNVQDKKSISCNSKFDDKNYDIIINTHGDLLPYYNHNENYDKENSKWTKSKPPIKITYCHYPLVPQLLDKRDYTFLEKFIDSFSELSPHEKDVIASKTLEKYNEMMKNTIILTNSNFSKKAIEKIYGVDKIKVTVIYPPVDIDKFRTLDTTRDDINTISNILREEKDKILVISRISRPKMIENAVLIGKVLKEKHNQYHFEINIVGNISSADKDYLQDLERLISRYNLRNNIKILTDLSLEELQWQLQKSSLYLHPTPDEPFGISIVEAMSAGLIPITPNKGGGEEFVPSQYQYSTIEDAGKIIAKMLINSNNIKYNSYIKIEKEKMKKLANKFSKQKYKENFKNLIESLS